MNIRNKYYLLWIGYICLVSCNSKRTESHGAIKLGDPSTIVTETDPQRLQDMVADLHPVIPPASAAKDTPKPSLKPLLADTAKKAVVVAAVPAPAPASALPAGPGLKAEFKEVTVVIPNLNAKLSGKPDLSKANGAVYTWTSGNMNGNVLHLVGQVTKVSQRYQSVVILKGKGGNLPLESLSETTGWKQISGNGGAFPIAGLSDGDLNVPDADASDIKAAVNKSCRTRRVSHKKMEEFLKEANGLKAANQRPLVVTLRSVMFKIDGKDAQGKLFSKQIRIDVPM